MHLHTVLKICIGDPSVQRSWMVAAWQGWTTSHCRYRANSTKSGLCRGSSHGPGMLLTAQPQLPHPRNCFWFAWSLMAQVGSVVSTHTLSAWTMSADASGLGCPLGWTHWGIYIAWTNVADTPADMAVHIFYTSSSHIWLSGLHQLCSWKTELTWTLFWSPTDPSHSCVWALISHFLNTTNNKSFSYLKY